MTHTPSRLRDELSKAYADWACTRSTVFTEDAVLFAAKWAFEKARQEICPHDGVQKVTHRFCCEHSNQLRQLGESLK